MKRWITSRLYLRMFVMQALIMLAVMIPFSLYLSSQFQKYAYDQIGSHIRIKVDQTFDNSNFMLDRLKSFSLNMYYNQDVQNWLFGKQKDVMIEHNVMTTVSQLLVNEPFVHSAYLINTRTQRIFDSRKGIVGMQDFADPELIETILHHRPNYLNFVDYEIDGGKFLMLMIPSDPSNTPYYGYLAVLLDAQLFQRFILGSDRNNGIEVFIMNDAGKVILGSADAELDQSVAARYGNRQEAAPDTMTFNGVVWNVSYKRMEGQRWNLYYLERMDLLSNEMKSLQNKVTDVMLILVVILLLIFFWSLRSGYKPVQKLARHMQSKLKHRMAEPEATLGEIQLIEQGVNHLFESMEQLNTSIEAQQQLLKDEYFRQWILQGKLGGTLLENINHVSNIATFTHLYLTVCRIDSYRTFVEKYNFSSRKTLKYAISNIAEEIAAGQGWACASIDFGSDHLVFMLGFSADIFDRIPSALEDIRHETERHLHLRVTLATSDRKQIDSDMRMVYDHIYELTMLKFISGNNRVYLEKDFDDYVNLLKPASDEERMDQLLKAVRLGSVDEASDVLSFMFDGMKHASYAECRYRLIFIIYSFMKEFSQLASIQSFDGISNQLERFGTLSEAHRWLEQEIITVIASLNQRNGSHRKEEFVAEIIEYIHMNIHNPTLSVEDISNHISLSVSYVRLIFKDVLKTTIADYILKERIERVKELLVTQSWSVADIAERSGFLTKSNFYTVFKKVTGYTPNEYRKMYQKE